MTIAHAPHPSPRTVDSQPRRAGLVLASLIAVAALANVALPDIGKAFDASQTSLDLVAVGYSLGLAASVLYLGALLTKLDWGLGVLRHPAAGRARRLPGLAVRPRPRQRQRDEGRGTFLQGDSWGFRKREEETRLLATYHREDLEGEAA